MDLNGKLLAKQHRSETTIRAEQLAQTLGRKPQLAVVLVGDNPASQVYVEAKSRMAKKCRIDTLDFRLPRNCSQVQLEQELRDIDSRNDVDGILLQLPLPAGLDELSALNCISPVKDVDGLHPANQGLLMRGAQAHRACTPLGCMALVDQAREQLQLSKDLSGLNAVVVGRSVLVGKPLGLMLLERNCSVTFCHSRTKRLDKHCSQADILIAAVGRPKMLGAEHVANGAIVIDVGINRLENGLLVGDVDYEAVVSKAAAITPVPGGVGPMTIAMLLSNTVDAAGMRI